MLDILCFSSTDWDGWWGSRQQVMVRMANRGYRVTYIEQLAGMEHLIRYPELRKRRKKKGWGNVRLVEENLRIITPPLLLPGRYYSETINKINMKAICKWGKRKLAFNESMPLILWLYKPEHCELIGNFNEQLSVYHCIDEPTVGTKGRKRKIIKKMDTHLARSVNVVFANSPPTYEKKKELNPNTFRIPSGVDFNHFSHGLKPDTSIHSLIMEIPKPRIGYHGRINDRLDYKVLELLAVSHPEWSLVLVGDTYPWTMHATPLRNLSNYPNVYFVGKVPYNQMPTIIKGFDVCILPYVDDERGHYRSPLKLYEYLAAGKPVVSIDPP